MKRVCTLRKVIFYRSYISWLFIATQFLSSLKYLQPGDFSCCKFKYIFETCKFLGTFFQKKAIFLMFFIK